MVYLLPITLLTGSFLPDLFLSSVSIIFLIFLIIEKKKKYINNRYFYFFFLFYLYLIFSSLISDNVIFSLESSVVYIRFILFPLAIWFLIDNNKLLIKHFTISLIITFLLALVDGYYQFIYGTSIFGINSLNPIRLNLLLNDKLILGGYLSRLIFLMIGLLLYYVKAK
jgi:hypothetical protein